MNKKIQLIFILLAFGSCTMAPKYVQPKSPVPNQFMIEKVADFKENKSQTSSVKWQEFFKSEDIKQVIQTCLNNNRDLKVAILNIEAARALYRINKSNLLPDIQTVGSLNKERTPKNVSSTSTPDTSSTYDAKLASTAFEIDLFGKIKTQNKSALETFLATSEAKNATQIALIAEVTNAYLQFLADREIWQLSQEIVITEEKAFELTKNKFTYGIISKPDLWKASSELETLKSNQALLNQRVEKDKNSLLLLMGVTNFDLLNKNSSLRDLQLMESLPIDLRSEILLKRPDIIQAEHQLKAANANIGVARAAFFPSISLTGSLGYSSSDLSNLFSGGSSMAWSFAPKINLPIFEGGRNFANLKYAKINKEIAFNKYEKSIQNAFYEVLNELSAYKNLTNQMQAQNEIVDNAENYYNSSVALHLEGVVSLYNVLNVKKQFLIVKQNQINTKKEKFMNLVQLYKVLGGGI